MEDPYVAKERKQLLDFLTKNHGVIVLLICALFRHVGNARQIGRLLDSAPFYFSGARHLTRQVSFNC